MIVSTCYLQYTFLLTTGQGCRGRSRHVDGKTGNGIPGYREGCQGKGEWLIACYSLTRLPIASLNVTIQLLFHSILIIHWQYIKWVFQPSLEELYGSAFIGFHDFHTCMTGCPYNRCLESTQCCGMAVLLELLTLKPLSWKALRQWEEQVYFYFTYQCTSDNWFICRSGYHNLLLYTKAVAVA